jgi:hypothetical protein
MISKNNNSFIDEMNKYYESQETNIHKIMDVDKNYDYVFSENESGKSIVEIYDNQKLKLKAEYSVIGLYNVSLSVWYWGWNIQFINRNLVKKSNRAKKFSKLLKNDYKQLNIDKYNAEELYYVTSQGNFYISLKNIDKIIKLILYLTRAIWYFEVKFIDKNQQDRIDKIEYILIEKILQHA